MLTIQLDDFLDNGIIKEQSFRDVVDNFDWEKYKNIK